MLSSVGTVPVLTLWHIYISIAGRYSSLLSLLVTFVVYIAWNCLESNRPQLTPFFFYLFSNFSSKCSIVVRPVVFTSVASNRWRKGSSFRWSKQTIHLRGLSKNNSRCFITPLTRLVFTAVPSQMTAGRVSSLFIAMMLSAQMSAQMAEWCRASVS